MYNKVYSSSYLDILYLLLHLLHNVCCLLLSSVIRYPALSVVLQQHPITAGRA